MDIQHSILSIPDSHLSYIQIIRIIGYYKFHGFEGFAQNPEFKIYNKTAYEKGFIYCKKCQEMVKKKKLKKALSWKQHQLTDILYINIPPCKCPYEVIGLYEYIKGIYKTLKSLNIKYIVFDQPEYGVISLEKFISHQLEKDDFYEFILTQEEIDFF